MDTFDSDVIIVGAGPTGLMLAGELGLNGISTIVVERREQPVKESRALGFSARTIEEFNQRGLLARLGDVEVIPVGHFGGVPLDYRVVDGGSYGARGIPQSATEAMLAGWAAALGADVRRGQEVVGLAADEAGVTLQVATADGPATLSAGYVVGCDGGRSKVRSLAGIDFPGTEPRIELRFADIAGVELRPRFSGERVPGGMIMVLPLGPRCSRIVYFDRSEPLRTSPDAISFYEVADAFERLSGENIQDATPLWVSSATDSSRQAAEYRRGRVFVAGDAAHTHLPIGAQGMSAGVQDAVNLGWKLALAVNGKAPEGLLDTYHSERHPVGARILANTLAQSLLYLGGDEMTPLRDVFAELMAFEGVKRHLAGLVTGLDIAHDVGAEPGGRLPLGRRVANFELLVDGKKTSAHELLHSGRGVLLDLGRDPGPRRIAARWSDRVTTVVGEAAGASGQLIRPDGYLAWASAADPSPSSGPAAAQGLEAALTRWFGPPN